MDNIKFRKCTPNDVEKAVPLIFSSGPTAFSYVFQNDQNHATDFLKYAFQRKGGEFSFDNHYALMLEDELVGIGSIFSGKRANGFTPKDFLNIVSFYKHKSLPVLFKGFRTEQVIQLPKSDEICIAHLGIAKNYQGRGLGSQLITFLMKESNPTSPDEFVLDVSEENPKAQALYERLGFEVTKCEKSNLKNKYGHVANHFRMKYIGEN